jgi:calcium-independent phospholipase A2-gamma
MFMLLLLCLALHAFLLTSERVDVTLSNSVLPKSKVFFRVCKMADNARPTLRLLALDGGGVRGLASLYMLKQLLSHSGHDKPCQFFDMIAGTSTGGLIAIMLGCLNMSVDECIQAYIELMGTIFKKRHSVPFNVIDGKVRPRYSTQGLEQAIKGIITGKGLAEDALLRRETPPKCRTMVVALSGDARVLTNFTNWKKPGEQSDFYDKVKIWEAARATSAATSFFAPIVIDGTTFWDGALGANNPVDRLMREASSVWDSPDFEEKIRCIVSIGTGKPAPGPLGSTISDVGRSLIAIAADTENKAEDFCETHNRLVSRAGYFRFNPPYLDEVDIADADKRNIIRERTEIYGRDYSTRMTVQLFQQVAGMEHSTSAQNATQWEQFA